MTLFEEFEWRGMVSESTEACARRSLPSALLPTSVSIPTASSLHVGILLTVMGLARLQHAGHTPIALVGGGTGMIGDPCGKTEERKLLSTEQVDANASGIRTQLERFLDFNAAANAASMVNNADWLGGSACRFPARRRQALHRQPHAGEGVGEAAPRGRRRHFVHRVHYMLLQAYDFLSSSIGDGCTLQMGGNDQWGNITAGIELVRRVRGTKRTAWCGRC